MGVFSQESFCGGLFEGVLLWGSILEDLLEDSFEGVFLRGGLFEGDLFERVFLHGSF